jgi:NAD(P)H dehydrogenase (quinone)
LSPKALIVFAHPGERSLSHHFVQTANEELVRSNYEVDLLDLYKIGFNPVMSGSERASYYSERPDHLPHSKQLASAVVLVLVFPTWWFGMPAILKGWFDRVFAPGIAFDHADDFGPIKSRLTNLREIIVVTTLGSPWWVDCLLMFRPVRRILKRAVFSLCAPQARFRMLSFYSAEKADARRVGKFAERLRAHCRELTSQF